MHGTCDCRRMTSTDGVLLFSVYKTGCNTRSSLYLFVYDRQAVQILPTSTSFCIKLFNSMKQPTTVYVQQGRIRLSVIILVIVCVVALLHWPYLSNFVSHSGNITFRDRDPNTKVAPFLQYDWLHPITESPCFTIGFPIPTTGNGIGNHLFYYAGAMYVAWLTGRRPIILSSYWTKLDAAFDLDIARVSEDELKRRCPVQIFTHKYVYAYNVDVKNLTTVDANVSIKMNGSFCSWKYTQPIEDQLRTKLQFRRELTAFVDRFLFANVPQGWNASSFVRVGVHVRRGDFLNEWANRTGFTVASRDYLNLSMSYFLQRYRRVQFIVASNDIDWCRSNIDSSPFNPELVNITFSVGHAAEQDLALLARCNHTVMTTGTYSWWASWLANGTTVYYKEFPRRGSSLWLRSRAADYFPPTWIPMS